MSFRYNPLTGSLDLEVEVDNNYFYYRLVDKKFIIIAENTLMRIPMLDLVDGSIEIEGILMIGENNAS